MQFNRIHTYYYAAAACVLAVVFGGELAYGPEAKVSTPPKPQPPTTHLQDKQPISPIPLTEPLDPEKVALGWRLFREPRLSASRSTACHDCHNLEWAGIDRLPRSLDIRGGLDQMNTLTVFNSRYNFRQGWRGQAETLEDQLDEVMHNPKHMNSDWGSALQQLKADLAYLDAFARSYPQGLSEQTVKDALATYERSLITPNAPFDRYLRGDANAIDENAKQGYRLFKGYGCIACHQGINVGGQLFAQFGIFKDYLAEKTDLNEFDHGRFGITGVESDKYLFRVPSLRNVAKTAPYLHDGSVATLLDVIKKMAEFQLGRPLPEQDAVLIRSFLESLTGEFQGQSL